MLTQHRPALTILAAGAILVAALMGVYVVTSWNIATPNASAGDLITVSGMTLPFLKNATVVGPADSGMRIIVKFIPTGSMNETARSIILGWERANGVAPGVTEPGGESVHYFPNGTSITSTGSSYVDSMEANVTIGQLMSLLHVGFYTYRYDNQTFYANAADPKVPANVASSLSDILGINNFNATVRLT